MAFIFIFYKKGTAIYILYIWLIYSFLHLFNHPEITLLTWFRSIRLLGRIAQ